jgi:hypothetical protein
MHEADLYEAAYLTLMSSLESIEQFFDCYQRLPTSRRVELCTVVIVAAVFRRLSCSPNTLSSASANARRGLI